MPYGQNPLKNWGFYWPIGGNPTMGELAGWLNYLDVVQGWPSRDHPIPKEVLVLVPPERDGSASGPPRSRAQNPRLIGGKAHTVIGPPDTASG
jgi:hypothetical protein